MYELNDVVSGLVGLRGEPLYARRVSHVVASRSRRSYWIRKGAHNLAAFDFVHVTQSTRLQRATWHGPSILRGVPSHSRLHFVHVSAPRIISSPPLSLNLLASLFLCQSSVFHRKLFFAEFETKRKGKRKEKKSFQRNVRTLLPTLLSFFL